MRGLPAVSAILDRFLDRLDEVVDRCTTHIAETIPSYARLGDEYMVEVGRAVGQNVRILVQVLQHGREVTHDELEPIEKTGGQRAEVGIPLEDVLHAYRSVSRICWDVLAEECRAYDGDALEPTITIAEALLRYTDQVSSTVADAYARAQRSIVREQEGARREFLADLLYGTETSPDDLLRRAHVFGYDLSLSYLALVGLGPLEDQRKEATVAAAVATVAGGGADPIVLQKGEHTIALIPTDPLVDDLVIPEKLTAELVGDWRFGLGGPELGLEGIRRVYLEAREALEIGMALGMGGPVYRFNDLLLYHFLRSEPGLVDRFVAETVGPVIAYDERRKGDLMNTLESYFEADGSVKMAGQALFAHPHTVSYRLKQVEKLTGWSLRDPEDKLRLQLAIRAHRIAQARRE